MSVLAVLEGIEVACRGGLAVIGPCDARGKPSGPMTTARARVVSDEEKPRAEEIVQSNYGLARRIYKASFSGRVEDAYVEVTPT